MARVDGIPIDSGTTAGVIAEALELAFCCSSVFGGISMLYPNIEKIMATRRPSSLQLRSLSRRCSTVPGRKSMASSLAVLSILTGNRSYA